MKRALVTGASGYIGGALCKELVRLGVKVSTLGRGDPILETVRKAKPDVVYHLATRYVRTHASDHVADLIDSNVRFGTLLLEAMVCAGVRRIVSAGTYFQFPEPLTLYAATKRAFKSIADYYEDAEQIEHTVLVLFDVYGRGDPRKKLINTMLEAQRTEKLFPTPLEAVTLDLVHISDVVRAFVQAGEQFHPGSFAVTSGELLTIREIADVINHVRHPPLQLDVGGYMLPDRSVLWPWRGDPLPGWHPHVSLEEGIRQLAEERVS